MTQSKVRGRSHKLPENPVLWLLPTSHQEGKKRSSDWRPQQSCINIPSECDLTAGLSAAEEGAMLNHQEKHRPLLATGVKGRCPQRTQGHKSWNKHQPTWESKYVRIRSGISED